MAASVVRNIGAFVARARTKFWFLPLVTFVLVMGFFGGMLLFTKGSTLVPFLYTLF